MITNFADILADEWEQLNHYLKMDLLEFFLRRIWCEKHFAILIKLFGRLQKISVPTALNSALESMIFSDPHKKTGVAYGWSTVWTGEVCGGTADDSEGSECHHEFDVGAFVFRQPRRS